MFDRDDVIAAIRPAARSGGPSTSRAGASSTSLRLALAVAFVLLPLMVLTGLTMSAGLDSAFHILLDVFGGRPSARSIHFICASLLVAFVVVHVVMVLVSGVRNNMRSMITGIYAIDVKGGPM